MNVMAKAHRNTKARFARGTVCKPEGGVYTYAQIFRFELVAAHKEYKAMKPEIKEAIDQFNKRIAELRALPNEGYIQVLGSARVVINAEVGCLSSLATCPVYAHKEDASFYDGRVVNGKGETNHYVSKADQIRFMVIQCKEAIQGLLAQ